MALGDVPISGTIAPTDRALDTYATHEDQFQKRGFRVVNTTAEMNAITPQRRDVGMWVLNLFDGLLYELQSDLTTWLVRPTGGSGTVVTGVDVTGTLPTLTLIPSGVTAGTYGNATNVPQIVFDAKGRATSAANIPILLSLAQVTGLTAALAAKVDDSEVGVTIATLVAGTVPLAQLPFSATAYQGTWDANTNTPVLADGVGTAGDFYWIIVQANRDLGSGVKTWLLGYGAVYDGAVWQVGTSMTPLAIQNIITDNGTLNGATVTLDSTAQIADSTNRRYVDDAEKDGLDNAPTTPSAANPFVTMADLNFSIYNLINTWNANTNTPTLADGIGTLGDAYIVGVAGTQDLGSGPITFAVGDIVFYNASGVWTQVGSPAAGVISVNGFTGIVVLDADDIPESATRFYLTANQNAAADGANAPSGANVFATMADISFSPINLINTWNATTNVPALADGVGTLGDGYLVGVGGVRNLGSGAITWTVGSFVVYNASNVWQQISGISAGVTSWNGSTGVVTADTSDVPESTNANYVTDSQEAGLDATQAGAFPASATNPYATEAYVQSIASSLTVTNEWNTPERYGDGTNTVGTTLGSRLLNTLIDPATGVLYTNASASSRWNLVTGINVATDEYDETCVDQMFRGMELASGSSAATFHDNRVYMYRQSHNMARVSQTSSTYRPVSWVYNGNGSRHYNISGQARTLWKRTPTNQTEAVGAPNPFTSYKVIMKDMAFIGANLGVKNSGDCCVEISATYGTILENVDCLKADIGLKMFFCLGGRVLGGHYSENSRSGILIATGAGYGAGPIWSGAGATNSASNGAVLQPSRVASNPGAFSGIEAYCADGLVIGGDVPVSTEGSTALPHPDHHIYFDPQGITVCKAMSVSNIHVEQTTRISTICVVQDPAQRITAYIDRILPYLNPLETHTLFEARTNGANARVCMVISDCPNKDTNWKFRQTGATSFCNWFVDMVQFADPLNPYAPINWNTTTIGGLAGVIPANGFFNQLRIAP